MARYYTINQNTHSHAPKYFGSLRLTGKKILHQLYTLLKAEAIVPKRGVFGTIQGHFCDISSTKQLIINKLYKIAFLEKQGFYDKTSTIYYPLFTMY